ncbi:MAG TPA: hypothetical protein DCW90_17265 [Lachnospiraceae bacterium]|nr:TIR domain-containing protein [uncultured Lachnoclostridium sp.]HAU87165.1 hypothetical protein [Lachnospiraceae bacterium]
MKKHKVFISYYHKDDQHYKDELLELNKKYDIFDNYSVPENDVDDRGKTRESIRKIIRDKYIIDATVLVLLCGRNTRGRKFIDWELHAAMYDTKKNPKMGILVINLPMIEQCEHAGDENDKNLIDDNRANWVSLAERQEYEKAFSYLPWRVMDNISKGIPISVVNWSKVYDAPEVLKALIHNAFARRKCTVYKNNALLKRKNS